MMLTQERGAIMRLPRRVRAQRHEPIGWRVTVAADAERHNPGRVQHKGTRTDDEHGSVRAAMRREALRERAPQAGALPRQAAPDGGTNESATARATEPQERRRLSQAEPRKRRRRSQC